VIAGKGVGWQVGTFDGFEWLIEEEAKLNFRSCTSLNRESFELFMTLMKIAFTERVPDIKKKFRIVLEHDPEKKSVEITTFTE
jgi:hypothetical protein